MSEPEYLTMGEARRELGVSTRKITQLVRDGILPSEPNPLDKRSRVIKRADVEALKRKGRPEGERTARKDAA